MYVEKCWDELWVAVKFQTNLEIAQQDILTHVLQVIFHLIHLNVTVNGVQ